MLTTSVTKEEFNAMIDVIGRQNDIIKSQASDIKSLEEWLRLQHDRMDELENQDDFALEQIQKTQKHIFWYALGIIFSNIALLMMLGIMMLR